jgi:gliding motility-associated-like protein
VTDLDVFGEDIIDLTGLESFVNLKNFFCGDNLFSSIDLSKNTFLEYLDCHPSKLTSLDVSKNLKLTNLVCEGSQLTNLDVSKNTALKYLNCGGLQSTNLDVSKNTVLVTLICRRSQLTSLDVSNNKSLLYIDCIYNNLINLNLKNGNNATMGGAGVLLQFNPNLNCIQVDDVAYSNANWSSRKDVLAIFSETCSITPTSNVAPILTATGNNTYCPLTSVNIVTSISITDPDSSETDAIYIQISSGYVNGQDQLFLNNALAHPNIKSSWNVSEGKLTLKSPIKGTQVSYIDFENAIKDVQFSNSSTNPTGARNFSISIGQANYLPRNGHYYEYVPNIGITWTNAKTAADAKTYYGLKGYLATITAADEAQLAGKQAPGAGWIGGSDSATEGVWKWVTGPEAGTVFWNGLVNGSTPNFAFWNTGEPNQYAGVEEDYAHITAPGVGVAGSWNDLPIGGDPSGDYQPKGYIVEYGGTAGDPTLQLSASTTLTIASITSTTPAIKCDAGTLTLKATATIGTINWYDAITGGNYIGTGTSFTTPNINTTTTYFVETTTANCSSDRTAVEAKIYIAPTITNTNSPATNCGPGLFTLTATPSAGTVNWYSQINGTIIGNGLSYTTPTISVNTTYYAEASNNGCTNNTKIPVQLLVYPAPTVNDQAIEKCSSSTILLDASIPNMNYLWNTGQTTQTITVSTTGIYNVEVTSPAPENCTARKAITVTENNTPEIKNILVDETTVTVELVKSEDYFEYSIDGIYYQGTNVFRNVPSGLQTAYVRDINMCSSDNKAFIVIIVPKYFTPNNDGFNDEWEVKGLINYPLAEVTLFDRYGKLITKLNNLNSSWDGTFNKNPSPATDYWYILKLDQYSPEVKGHFSLKR